MTVMPTIPNNTSTLRDVLCQLYQVLGAEDVPVEVLDVCSAAMRGVPIPNIDILPYHSTQADKIRRLEAELLEVKDRLAWANMRNV